MNIFALHTDEKPVSTHPIFKGIDGTATTIKILEGAQLKEHITKVPALLICMEGNVVFENEKRIKENMQPGDFVSIEPMVKHWLVALATSQLILLK